MKCSKHHMAIEPGVTIKEMLNGKMINLPTFARSMEMTREDTSLLLSGKIKIDDKIASKLETVLGPSKTFWKNLEARYQDKLDKVSKDIY